ncbi:MAG TPA: M23 family metallopeptidase [Anaerolineae bacterium]|nr:M23 family metallopeptidase [Anaerolineae bacterium]
MAGRFAITLLMVLIAVLILRLVVPAETAHAEKIGGANSQGVMDAKRADPIPPGGDCRRTGWKYSINPFSGWPLRERVCERSVVVWTYCSTRYPTAYPHWGVDLAFMGIEGTEVVATTDRAIVSRMHDEGQWNGGMGNYVELHAFNCRQEPLGPHCRDDVCVELSAHDHGFEGPSYDLLFHMVELCEPTHWLATYMHLQEVTVRVGEVVERGDVIGLVGATGNAGGAHLHYEITSPYDAPGGAIDPLPTLCETWVGE